MPPPSAAVGANPYSTPRANPLFSGQHAVGGMQQNPLAAMNGALNQPSAMNHGSTNQPHPPAFDRHTMAMYAERRSFNISGDGHGAAQQRVPDGRVRGFDEPEADFGVHRHRRQRQAPEPEGIAELRRDLEAHGLADEFDPNEGRHPMEVAAERERLKRIEAAAKLGPKAIALETAYIKNTANEEPFKDRYGTVDAENVTNCAVQLEYELPEGVVVPART